MRDRLLIRQTLVSPASLSRILKRGEGGGRGGKSANLRQTPRALVGPETEVRQFILAVL